MRRRSFLALLASLPASLGLSGRASRPSAIVVGGGPAGVSAALELAERGVDVTLLESAGELGGKVRGWTQEVGGRQVDAEHGVHGWWHQYVHFTDLLARAGLAGALGEPSSTAAVRGHGGEVHTGTFRARRRFAAWLALQAGRRGHRRFRRELLDWTRWSRRLDPATARRELGGRSAADWCDSQSPATFFGLLPDLVAPSIYCLPPGRLDASEYAIGEHFYGTGTPRNSRVRWLRGNPQELIWRPLATRLRALGAIVRTGTQVTDLVTVAGAVAGVRLGRKLAGARLDEPPPAWTAIPREGGAPMLVGRDGDGRLRAFSARCPHAGCTVAVARGGFECPCHGGRFDTAGRPVAGPPRSPLRSLHLEEGTDGIYVEEEDRREELRADAVVLAVDVPALRALVSHLLPAAAGLRSCPETVARFWLDRDVSPEASPAAMMTGFTLATNGFLVHRLQRSAADFARSTGGSVVELQAFGQAPEGAERGRLLDRLEAELRAAWPELGDARVLGRTLSRGHAFTAFDTGWLQHALPVRPGIPGLLLAGDHVLIDHPAQFMERAVLSGRMAANAILDAAGLPAAPILPLRP